VATRSDDCPSPGAWRNLGVSSCQASLDGVLKERCGPDQLPTFTARCRCQCRRQCGLTDLLWPCRDAPTLHPWTTMTGRHDLIFPMTCNVDSTRPTPHSRFAPYFLQLNISVDRPNTWIPLAAHTRPPDTSNSRVDELFTGLKEQELDNLGGWLCIAGVLDTIQLFRSI
jgi:hypothetical protein